MAKRRNRSCGGSVLSFGGRKFVIVTNEFQMTLNFNLLLWFNTKTYEQILNLF